MATNTTNYNLIKPDYIDVADIKDINDNMDAIDAALKEKLGAADIIDNVTSTDTDKPLSANQGKLLRDDLNRFVLPTGGIKEIKTGSFNDLVETGNYDVKCELVTEGPISTGWAMLMNLASDPNNMSQIAHHYTTNTTYTRRRNVGNWSKWVRLEQHTDFVTISNGSFIQVAKKIRSGDLPPMYWFKYANMTDNPTGSEGGLCLMQYVATYSSNVKVHLFPDGTDVNTIYMFNVKTDNTTSEFYSLGIQNFIDRNGKTPLKSGVDLNSLTMPGMYDCNTACTNKPGGGAYFVHVFTDGNIVKQIACYEAGDGVYERVRYSGNWSSWKAISNKWNQLSSYSIPTGSVTNTVSSNWLNTNELLITFGTYGNIFKTETLPTNYFSTTFNSRRLLIYNPVSSSMYVEIWKNDDESITIKTNGFTDTSFRIFIYGR